MVCGHHPPLEAAPAWSPCVWGGAIRCSFLLSILAEKQILQLALLLFHGLCGQKGLWGLALPALLPLPMLRPRGVAVLPSASHCGCASSVQNIRIQPSHWRAAKHALQRLVERTRHGQRAEVQHRHQGFFIAQVSRDTKLVVDLISLYRLTLMTGSL